MLDLLMKQLTTRLKQTGCVRTAKAYESAVRSIRKELGNTYSGTEFFTPDALRLYEQRMRSRGLANNTISFYMRMLRAIHNKGVDLNLFSAYPGLFDHVFTGIDVTAKRSVQPELFGKLQELELSGKPNLAFCRDMFLLSFSLQGISFIDLAFLRKSDLKHNILTYHRAKTGSLVQVAVSDFALQFIERYAPQTRGSVFLLPIIMSSESNTRLQYQSALRTYNRRLKKIAALAGISEKLTSYVSRHTWATTAQQIELPISLISQGLGHGSEKVTHIYLAGFDHESLFGANEQILMAAKLIAPVEKKQRFQLQNQRTANMKKRPSLWK